MSGGAVVSIYTDNKYQSFDLDFVSIADRKKIKSAMEHLGFEQERSRYFTHPKSKFFVEFPGAAVLVGDQPIENFSKLKIPGAGTLKLLTPTDCVKDRLSAYYHWSDRQSLNQAVWVSQAQPVKIDEIKRWSTREGHQQKLQDYLEALKKKH